MDFLCKYGINIKDQNLLLQALTHSSYANENKCECYERLEFLGDAVLQIIISEYLYKTNSAKEGQLSKLRSRFVCEEALCFYVRQIGFDKYIRVGNGLLNQVTDNIVADTFEAVLAVIYLECGLDKCKEYINLTVIPYIQEDKEFFKDYKTALQEMVQTDKKSLEYVLVESSGEDHNKKFVIKVLVDKIALGIGEGHSKKEAEQNAAKMAIEKSAR